MKKVLLSIESFDSKKTSFPNFSQAKSKLWSCISKVGSNGKFQEIMKQGIIISVGIGDAVSFWKDV